VCEQTAAQLRGFLHAVLEHELSESQRATAVCALRGVGDESSVERISALPVFDGPWSGLESTVTRAIRRRLSRSAGR
jgi:hypothetical protein